MKRQSIALAIILISSIALADEKRVHSREFKKDGISITLGTLNGYTITVDGVPFSSSASFSIVDPSWQNRYYGYADHRERVLSAQVSEIEGGGQRIVIPLRSRAEAMEATQTVELLPGRRLRIGFDTRMTSDTPAVLENKIAAVAEGWFTNSKFSSKMRDGSTTSGVTPRWAPSAIAANSTLASDLRTFKVETPRGELGIMASGSAPVTLVDYRRNEWAENGHFYWLGVLGFPLPGMETLSYHVTFQFPDRADPKHQKVAEAKTNSVSLGTSQTVFALPSAIDQVIPTPKQITWSSGTLAIRKEIPVYCDYPDNIKQAAENIIGQYSKRLERHYGVALKTFSSPKDAVVHARFKLAEDLLKFEAEEYYALNVNDKTVELDSGTTTGLENGLKTLEQLLRFSGDGQIGIRQVAIKDYPSMPFRGIHFFTGDEGPGLQTKMLQEIMAPLKLNKLVFQVDYINWDSQPQIHSDKLGMSKADAKSIGDVAWELGIEVIPLINTFGHSEWLLQRPAMRYLADNPDSAYAYDPSNPKVYEICETIYNEAIELFHPRIMHIGHDEVNLDGFPHKPENKALGATQLLINDTVHYYNFLKAQGIRTMIWGDMFLAPGESPDATLAPSVEEAKRRRSLLPTDIMIADWHYKVAPVEDYKSLKIFNDAGFETVACPWDKPENQMHFARQAALQRNMTTKSLGLLQTTWAGYTFNENSIVNDLDQYTAYVLAAEAAWTGGGNNPDVIPFDYKKEFLRRWVGNLRGGVGESGWLTNLESLPVDGLNAANLSLADDAFDALKTGRNDLSGYAFNLSQKDGKIAALTLAGAFDKSGTGASRQSIVLGKGSEAGGSAREIYFALAAPNSASVHSRVGRITMTMDDASTKSIDLIYGKNIMGISDDRQTMLAPIIWQSPKLKPNQGAAVIHLLRWENPDAGKKVKSIEFEALPTGSGIMVFGVSGRR